MRKGTRHQTICRMFAAFAVSAVLFAGSMPAGAKDAVVEQDTATNVIDAFLAIPASELGILPHNTRLDMIDYLAVDSLVHARNLYRGESWIKRIAPGYMEIHLTEVSDLTIKRLPGKKGEPVFMTIYTVSGEGTAADSSVKFYNCVMDELDCEKIMKTPDPKKFWHVPKDSGVDLKTLMAEVPFYTIEYTASADDDNLTGRLTMDSYLTQEVSREVSPYLVKKIVWSWDGKKYSLK